MTAGAEFRTVRLLEAAPKTPILVCGLPGSGYVGKLAVEHLITVFKARKMVEYHSPSFPPHANVGEDGLVHAVRGELYLGETGQANDLLIFTADAQPATSAGEYALTELVLEESKKMGAALVVSLAAFITGGFTEDGRVFGTSTSQALRTALVENGVTMMSEGVVTGMNGVMVGMASLNGMEGVCLLGETSGYMVDPGASQAVLEAMSRMLKLEVDLSTLRERAVEAKELIGQIQRMTEQEEGRAPGPGPKPGYIG